MGKERTQHTSWYKEIENFVLVKESMVGNILQDILHEWMLEDIPEENLSEEISWPLPDKIIPPYLNADTKGDHPDK